LTRFQLWGHRLTPSPETYFFDAAQKIPSFVVTVSLGDQLVVGRVKWFIVKLTTSAVVEAQDHATFRAALLAQRCSMEERLGEALLEALRERRSELGQGTLAVILHRKRRTGDVCQLRDAGGGDPAGATTRAPNTTATYLKLKLSELENRVGALKVHSLPESYD
jgi:hypothetical protein